MNEERRSFITAGIFLRSHFIFWLTHLGSLALELGYQGGLAVWLEEFLPRVIGHAFGQAVCPAATLRGQLERECRKLLLLQVPVYARPGSADQTT